MQNAQTLNIVLLIALPASGKSKVRRYLEYMDKKEHLTDFHLGETVQLDDFPYVHFMKCIDHELTAIKQPTLFGPSPEKPFFDTKELATLVELLNEDYNDLVSKKTINPLSVVDYYFNRIDEASATAGLPKRITNLIQIHFLF